MDRQYSVLMSVYNRERPEYLQAAINSILGQTMLPAEVIVVCDGALTEPQEVILTTFKEQLVLVRLPENVGLGRALSEGLKHCSHEWIARMDSDDIAFAERCERQLQYLEEHPEVDVLSGTVAEFTGDALTAFDAGRHVISYKKVPAAHSEVAGYIKYRNPVNHPCVMLRRRKVIEAGGYLPCPLFEDYDLWVRMYQQGCIFANLEEPILYMRVNEMHQRRGGVHYVSAILHFWTGMYRRGMITRGEYLQAVLPRVMVSLLPNRGRKAIYHKRLRNH